MSVHRLVVYVMSVAALSTVLGCAGTGDVAQSLGRTDSITSVVAVDMPLDTIETPVGARLPDGTIVDLKKVDLLNNAGTLFGSLTCLKTASVHDTVVTTTGTGRNQVSTYTQTAGMSYKFKQSGLVEDLVTHKQYKANLTGLQVWALLGWLSHQGTIETNLSAWTPLTDGTVYTSKLGASLLLPESALTWSLPQLTVGNLTQDQVDDQLTAMAGGKGAILTKVINAADSPPLGLVLPWSTPPDSIRDTFPDDVWTPNLAFVCQAVKRNQAFTGDERELKVTLLVKLTFDPTSEEYPPTS